MIVWVSGTIIAIVLTYKWFQEYNFLRKAEKHIREIREPFLFIIENDLTDTTSPTSAEYWRLDVKCLHEDGKCVTIASSRLVSLETAKRLNIALQECYQNDQKKRER